jgi:hypothetical protein
MKSLKIMLTAIVVLALVGGALAFKAKKFNDVCIYSLNQAGDECELLPGVFDLTNNGTEISGTFIDEPAGGCDEADETTATEDCDQEIEYTNE